MQFNYERELEGEKSQKNAKKPNENLPAKQDEKKPDFWNLALK